MDPTGEALVDWVPGGRLGTNILAANNSKYGSYLDGHLNRNISNTGLPCTPPLVGDPEWVELKGWKKVGFHRFPTSINLTENFGNRNFISSDGKREVIFSRNGSRIGHPTNAGTFNKKSPTSDPIGHVLEDVVPYFLFGNGPSMLEGDCSCSPSLL